MIKGFLLLLAVFGWGLAAAALHVVVGPGDLTVVPKERLGITDTYVDTRQWSMDDVAEHPLVTRRLISARKSSALEHVKGLDESDDVAVQLMAALEEGEERREREDEKPKRQRTFPARIVSSVFRSGH